MPKLSPAQSRMLAALRASRDGRLMPPWGTRDSGRDASAWWRTAACLIKRGLAERRSNDEGLLVGIFLTTKGAAA